MIKMEKSSSYNPFVEILYGRGWVKSVRLISRTSPIRHHPTPPHTPTTHLTITIDIFLGERLHFALTTLAIKEDPISAARGL